ncbi:hypothetical protein BGX26_006564 [Mortierella sp. AD094]|nr:hypothetical protein BGX26_006564 [Mortierella sp. AD094]
MARLSHNYPRLGNNQILAVDGNNLQPAIDDDDDGGEALEVNPQGNANDNNMPGDNQHNENNPPGGPHYQGDGADPGYGPPLGNYGDDEDEEEPNDENDMNDHDEIANDENDPDDHGEIINGY